MMFGCEETRRYVDAWIDGELDPGASLLVEAHVVRCGECRGEAEMIRSLKGALGALRESDRAGTALQLRIAAALDAEDSADQRVAQSAQKRKHAAGFVLAGAALAGFVLAVGRHTRTAPSDVQFAQGEFAATPVLESIVGQSARDLPVEVPGDRPERVGTYFRNWVDVPVRPVAFHGMQTSFGGARLANVRDRMGAALAYYVNGRRVTVFTFDSALLPRDSVAVRRAVVGNQDVYIGNRRGFTVVFVERDGVGYAITTDGPVQDAVRMAQSFDIQ
jgi:anti-sigma factor RsiW